MWPKLSHWPKAGHQRPARSFFTGWDTSKNDINGHASCFFTCTCITEYPNITKQTYNTRKKFGELRFWNFNLNKMNIRSQLYMNA